jgi:hypothetical protein
VKAPGRRGRSTRTPDRVPEAFTPASASPARFLPNIDDLVKHGGEITVGLIGPVPGAAASDGDQTLAMLVRRPRESLKALLTRLDAAIGKAGVEGEIVDEINP